MFLEKKTSLKIRQTFQICLHPGLAVISKSDLFQLVFQFVTVWAEILHNNRFLYSQQSNVFGFLILTVFGGKMTS